MPELETHRLSARRGVRSGGHARRRPRGAATPGSGAAARRSGRGRARHRRARVDRRPRSMCSTRRAFAMSCAPRREIDLGERIERGAEVMRSSSAEAAIVTAVRRRHLLAPERAGRHGERGARARRHCEERHRQGADEDHERASRPGLQRADHAVPAQLPDPPGHRDLHRLREPGSLRRTRGR